MNSKAKDLWHAWFPGTPWTLSASKHVTFFETENTLA
jgi:hypothetical protein